MREGIGMDGSGDKLRLRCITRGEKGREGVGGGTEEDGRVPQL